MCSNCSSSTCFCSSSFCIADSPTRSNAGTHCTPSRSLPPVGPVSPTHVATSSPPSVCGRTVHFASTVSLQIATWISSLESVAAPLVHALGRKNNTRRRPGPRKGRRCRWPGWWRRFARRRSPGQCDWSTQGAPAPRLRAREECVLSRPTSGIRDLIRLRWSPLAAGAAGPIWPSVCR